MPSKGPSNSDNQANAGTSHPSFQGPYHVPGQVPSGEPIGPAPNQGFHCIVHAVVSCGHPHRPRETSWGR